jgi:hypothetical protein
MLRSHRRMMMICAVAVWLTGVRDASAQTSGINVTFDTVTRFSGNFQIVATDSPVSLTPTQFSFLPGGGLELGRDIDFDEVYIFPVGLPPEGLDPSFVDVILPGLSTYPSLSGSYTGLGDVNVTFEYFNLQDTGGPIGTFSGEFSFVVPEPSSLAALGAAAYALTLRRKRRM